MFVSLYTLCWFTQLPAQDSCKGTVLQICINWWVSHDLLSRWGQDSRHGELPLVTVNPIQKLQEPSWSARNGNSHNPFNFPSNLPGQSCQQPTVLQPYWYSMGDGVLLDAGPMWPYRFPLRQIDSYWLNRLLCRTELTNNIHLGDGRGLLGEGKVRLKPLVPFCHKTFTACCHFTWGSLISESETPVKRCSS